MRRISGAFLYGVMACLTCVCLMSCSGKGTSDTTVATKIRLYNYGSNTAFDTAAEPLAVTRFIEIRVFDNKDTAMNDAMVLFSFDTATARTYETLGKNADGVWIVDPTGKTDLYVKTGDLFEHVTLDTTGLIKTDPASSVDFSGQEPPEYLGPFGAQGELTLTPSTLLDTSTVPANLYHILYLVDWQNTRTEVERVPYDGKTFSLNLGNYSNVSIATTFVFKNTLAIIENNRILYETPLSAEATVVFH